MAIEDFTEDALKAELERRKKKTMAPPKPVANPDWSQLLQTMASGIEDMVKEGYEDEDLRVYVYESAFEAMYGKEFWEWQKRAGISRM